MKFSKSMFFIFTVLFVVLIGVSSVSAMSDNAAVLDDNYNLEINTFNARNTRDMNISNTINRNNLDVENENSFKEYINTNKNYKTIDKHNEPIQKNTTYKIQKNNQNTHENKIKETDTTTSDSQVNNTDNDNGDKDNDSIYMDTSYADITIDTTQIKHDKNIKTEFKTTINNIEYINIYITNRIYNNEKIISYIGAVNSNRNSINNTHPKIQL